MLRQGFSIAVVVVLAGCSYVHAKRVPGETQADARSKFYVTRMIGAFQQAQQPECGYTIKNTRAVGSDAARLREEWVVQSCEEELVYQVVMVPQATGGTVYKVTTPMS